MKRIAAMLMAVILPFTLALSGCGSTQSEVKTQMSNQTATPSGTQDTASQAPSDASDTSGDATGQKAKLTYLGRATVRIETAAGKVIYIDPYGKGDYSKPADIVLIT
ncbi:MAG: MBL fold metallo-hydrolase, partial [Clostridia bacterium]|nr:MBL fold metallo-hydrolase [Clostridia bacterium]